MGFLVIFVSLIQNSFASPQTDLAEAIQSNHLKNVLKALKKHNEIDFKAAIPGHERKDNVVALAARVGNPAVMAAILAVTGSNTDQFEKENGFTPLMIAAQEGHKSVVQMLLNRGADINHQSHEHGYTALRAAVNFNRAEVAQLLLFRGANPNIAARDHFTPIFMAVQKNDVEMIKTLAQHGDVNVTSEKNKGVSPLHKAVAFKYFDAVQTLIRGGASINQKDSAGITPLLYAIEFEDERSVELLLNYHADVEASSNEGVTPLVLALKKQNFHIVEMLINKGAKVNSAGPGGFSPVHMMATVQDPRIVRLMLAHGANVDMPVVNCIDSGLDGYTPLHMAAEAGIAQNIRLLLRAGANVNSKSKKGYLPLHSAVQAQKPDVIKELMWAGSSTEGLTLVPAPEMSGEALADNQCIVELPLFMYSSAKNKRVQPAEIVGPESISHSGASAAAGK